MKNITNSNSTEQTEWIEQQAIPEFGFRIWHVMFLCFSLLLIIVIVICCCVKIRIPRTKQEIEADYQRKKIARKFRERLRLIQNQEIDNMDLKRALERVQTDFENETNRTHLIEEAQNKMKAEPQQPSAMTNTTRKLSLLLAFTRNKDASFKC